MWEPDTITFLFLGALILSIAITWAVLRTQGNIGMDHPDEFRKQHARPISRLGGAPIVICLIVGYVTLAVRQPVFSDKWLPVLVTNVLIFTVGFLDDLRPLGAKVKLVGQIGVALVLYALGISIDVLSNPFGSESIVLGWWSLPLTLFWLVAIPNIINLIDGMDGLATGFGMFLCITLAFVGHFSGMTDIVLMSTVMAGALAGVLIFNFPPAKIFLGDGGAYLIGFFVASVSLMSSQKGSIIAGLLVMLVALGVPILDTFFAIVRRAIRGVPIFRADAEHIHHRLMVLGFSKAKALVALYSVCLVLSVLGISVLWSKGISLPIVGSIVFLLALGAARYLGYVKSWRTLKSQFQNAMLRRKDMLYAGAYARVVEWEVECGESIADYENALFLSFDRIKIHMSPSEELTKSSISMTDGRKIYLYHSNKQEMQPLWRAKIELFQTPLNLAYERWGLEAINRLEHN